MTEDNQKFTINHMQKILEVLQAIFDILSDLTVKNVNFDRSKEFMANNGPINHWHNQYNHTQGEGEINKKPSLTIPDQSMTVPELMKRHAQGLPLGGGKVPVYDEDPENPMPDLSKMDLIDQHETIAQAKDEMYNIRNKYAQELADKKQKEYNDYKQKYEELDKKYKKEQESRSSLNPDPKSNK